MEGFNIYNKDYTKGNYIFKIFTKSAIIYPAKWLRRKMLIKIFRF